MHVQPTSILYYVKNVVRLSIIITSQTLCRLNQQQYNHIMQYSMHDAL